MRLHNPMMGEDSNLRQRLLYVVLFAALAGASLWLTRQEPIFLLALTAVIALGLTLIFRPQVGAAVFVAFTYANFPVVLGRSFGNAQLIAALSMILIAVPIVVYVLIRKRGFVIDYSFLLMLLFLASILISSLMAKDSRLAFKWISTFILEGLLIYLLLINGIRNLSTLKSTIWALAFVGILLGGISLYQEMTGSYNSQFGGLVQRNTEEMDEDDMNGSLVREREKVRLGHRAGGPTGGPNRFAQILIVLLPLAAFRMRDERSKPLKILAAVAAFLILSGILLTYSRSTFLSLMLLTVILIFLRYIRVQHALLGAVAVAVGITIVAPGYLNRIDSIRSVPTLFSNRDAAQADGSTRGRLTEMLAAFNAFLDHPVFGVGPGQYTPYYSVQYMENPDIAFRSIGKSRRSHCLYSELAAEVGLLGFISFMGILLLIAWRLWKLRCHFLNRQPELSNLAMGFLVAILAYLITAVFLQLAYQRYLWILVGMAGATVQILNQHTRQPSEEVEAQRYFAKQAEEEVAAEHLGQITR